MKSKTLVVQTTIPGDLSKVEADLSVLPDFVEVELTPALVARVRKLQAFCVKQGVIECRCHYDALGYEQAPSLDMSMHVLVVTPSAFYFDTAWQIGQDYGFLRTVKITGLDWFLASRKTVGFVSGNPDALRARYEQTKQ